MAFQPEGIEDLTIYDVNDNPIEITQIKAHTRNLTLTSFSPNERGSFFYRTADYLTMYPEAAIKIVGFGGFGEELNKLNEQNPKTISNLARKLSRYQHVTEPVAQNLLSRIRTEEVEENALKENVLSILRGINTAGDPQSAFELLTFWIFICSENKTRLTRTDLIDEINNVGRFISDKAAFHQEWYTTIVPLSNSLTDSETHDKLVEQFYMGMSARYDHICAAVDVLRPQRLQELTDGFAVANVVILHGASGQGKTTLAYRFLYDNFPSGWCFQVRAIQDRRHALTIATAISAHARAIGIPIMAYIDVSPADTDWPLLVRELSSQANIQVLVTIREEDFKRANISSVEFQPELVELHFDPYEAQMIFASLVAKKPSTVFQSFDEAWSRFGGNGPLMEFVYLVTQNQSLHERLQQQINGLRDDTRYIAGNPPQNIIDLLRLVAIVTATSARLEARPLAELVGLIDPARVFDLLEKEYLLKLDEEGALVQGLHPIRSRKIAELLTSHFTPWSESAITALPVIYEPDLQAFLLDSFMNYPSDIDNLCGSLAEYQPSEWCGIAGVTRALLWLGVREYYLENRPLLDEAYEKMGNAGMYLLDFDIANVLPDGIDSIEELFGLLTVSKEIEKMREEFLSRQTDKNRLTNRVKGWLSTRSQKPSIPLYEIDWSRMSEVLFWLDRLQIEWPLEDWFSEINFDEAVQQLPLNILGDVVLGLSYGHRSTFLTLVNSSREKIIQRFKKETHTVVVEDDGDKLTAHFIVGDWINQKAATEQPQPPVSKNPLHDGTIWRISLLSKLYPDRQVFASQGYGHRLVGMELPYDDTYKKGIDRKNITFWWLTWLNSTFRIMTGFPHRPKDWPEYAETILSLRENVLRTFSAYEVKVNQYFRQKKPIQMDGLAAQIAQTHNHVTKPLPLPQCAVDHMGFIDESLSKEAAISGHRLAPYSISVEKYQPFLKALRTYTTSLSNFLSQSQHVFLLNLLGRQAKTAGQSANVFEKAAEYNVDPKFVSLSVWNLSDTVKVLPSFQNEFHDLLSQYVDTARLTKLERQEQSLFQRLWSAWYFFAFHPEYVQHAASEIFHRRVQRVPQQVRQYFSQVLLQMSTDTLHLTFLNEVDAWGNEPTLCVMIDGGDAIEVYGMVEKLVAAVHASYNDVQEKLLRDYVVDFTWRSLSFVPLVKGRLIDENGFKIPFLPLAAKDEIKWWHYQPQPILEDTREILNELGFNLFVNPQLAEMASLRQMIISLHTLVAHIWDFIKLPRESEADNTELQRYVDTIVPQINQLFQTTLDSIANVLSAIKQIPSNDLLVFFSELIGKIRPDNSESETIHMELKIEDFGKWAEALSEAKLIAFGIYLQLATYLIHEEYNYPQKVDHKDNSF